MKVYPQEVKIILEWSGPINVIYVRNFLSLPSYYQRFMKEFPKTVTSLINVLREAIKFECLMKCEKGFYMSFNGISFAKIKGTNFCKWCQPLS